MRPTVERVEPASYRYVKHAADQLPPFTEEGESRRQLDELLITGQPLENLGPDLVEFFGVDLARSLADKIRSLAEEDSSGGRIAKAAIRWANRLDRRITEGDFPRLSHRASSYVSHPQFVGATKTRLPDGTMVIEYFYR
ncbi:hypothetical protein HY386_02255 [Candidatus Daviesbacteria bacterium]|nr:hypothetical protein [Candidatus Daviesbacteria bacterium]